MNPKALSLGELYGEYDLNTNEWTDGILSSVMRIACSGMQRIMGWGEQMPKSPKRVDVLGIESSIWEKIAWIMLRHKEASACISEEMNVEGGLGKKAVVSLSSIFYQDEKPDEKWILFDGPVDTLWIESMNSVMDDNKVLTLINGERIALPEQVQGCSDDRGPAEVETGGHEAQLRGRAGGS